MIIESALTDGKCSKEVDNTDRILKIVSGWNIEESAAGNFAMCLI